MDNNCTNSFFNILSKIYPFKFFMIDINRPPKKLEPITIDLQNSKLKEKLNTNDITMVQMLVTIMSILFTLSLYIFKTLNFLELSNGNLVCIFCISMMLSVIFKYYIKYILKQEKSDKLDSLIMINNYVLTMLKGGKIISEILYSLTIVNTPYKSKFEKGYELYKRSNREGVKYLINVFKDTYFIETIKVLNKFNEYDKESALKYLERINKMLKRQINQIKKSKFDIGFIYSQASIIFPFILLGLILIFPVVTIVFQLINNSVLGMK